LLRLHVKRTRRRDVRIEVAARGGACPCPCLPTRAVASRSARLCLPAAATYLTTHVRTCRPWAPFGVPEMWREPTPNSEVRQLRGVHVSRACGPTPGGRQGFVAGRPAGCPSLRRPPSIHLSDGSHAVAPRTPPSPQVRRTVRFGSNGSGRLNVGANGYWTCLFRHLRCVVPRVIRANHLRAYFSLAGAE